jgi:hypothetical protein
MDFLDSQRACNPAALRRELSSRNVARAARYESEQTCGEVPSVVYQELDGLHGNFHPSSYRSISADPEWRRRLEKSYTAAKWVPRSGDRKRRELDCANSSDALLMNVFCYPRLLRRPELCAILGIETGLRPQFGFRPRIPFANGKADRTEIDMSIGHLLIEAKLTETGFQSAPMELLSRYRDFGELFDIDELPIVGGTVHSYQLIRGVLAAFFLNRYFLVLCDGRRLDLQERWFRVMRAVHDCRVRNQLALITWQELATAFPKTLRLFVEEKYGIRPAPAR